MWWLGLYGSLVSVNWHRGNLHQGWLRLPAFLPHRSCTSNVAHQFWRGLWSCPGWRVSLWRQWLAGDVYGISRGPDTCAWVFGLPPVIERETLACFCILVIWWIWGKMFILKPANINFVAFWWCHGIDLHCAVYVEHMEDDYITHLPKCRMPNYLFWPIDQIHV